MDYEPTQADQDWREASEILGPTLAKVIWDKHYHESEQAFWDSVNYWHKELQGSAWGRVDLKDVLAQDYVPPVPEILGLFYPGMVNSVFGPSGEGKSWIALAACVEQIRRGCNVTYIDYEDSPGPVVARLKALGLSNDEIQRHFIYVHPDEVPDEADMIVINETMIEESCLVVVDSMGEALEISGFDENVGKDVLKWMNAMPRVWADLGPCLLLVDHMAKNSKDGSAIGSQRKKAAVDGHSVKVEQVIPFSREKDGRISLKCAKDRHGNFSRDEHLFDVLVKPGLTTVGLEFVAPIEHETEQLDSIVALVRDRPGINSGAIKKAIGGKNEKVVSALYELVKAGRLVLTKQGTAHTYSVPGAGNE
jgi:hypothetical protein